MLHTSDTPDSSAFYCPCGSGNSYLDCCLPYHQGQPAETAEQLMRSRYSAFSKQLIDYLIETHHPSKRQPDDRTVLTNSMAGTQWLKLQIVDTQEGLKGDSSGVVEFIATYSENGQLGQLHERSDFVFDDRWYYLSGEIFPSKITVGRNDPCPCGSGKKFKKCHG